MTKECTEDSKPEEERNCGCNNGGTETRTVTCDTTTGKWNEPGDWGECSAEECECQIRQTQGCGKCGTQTCGRDGSWGECQDEGECTPGERADVDSCSSGGSSLSKDIISKDVIGVIGSREGTNICPQKTCNDRCQWEEPVSTDPAPACPAGEHSVTLDDGTTCCEYDTCGQAVDGVIDIGSCKCLSIGHNNPPTNPPVAAVMSSMCCATTHKKLGSYAACNMTSCYDWTNAVFDFNDQRCEPPLPIPYYLFIRCELIYSCSSIDGGYCGKIQLYECPSGYSFDSYSKCIPGTSGKKYTATPGYSSDGVAAPVVPGFSEVIP
jgi:hypothetical protein